MSENPTFTQRADLSTVRARLATSTNRRYWRSLEEVAATPEFEEYLHREFPSQLEEWSDPVGRRKFLTLMAASLALAGVTGCTRTPDEKIVPYVRAPEDLVQGKPQYYATAICRDGYALGVLAESHMGRPTKLEGNPQHPASLGATDAFTQASILSLYDPDRSQTIQRRGIIDTWESFVTTMAREMETLRTNRGRGLRFLTGTITSPTLAAQLNTLLEELPEARWHLYAPGGGDNAREGALLAFGRQVDTVYQFARAKVVLSLDSDFLLNEPGSVRYAREFVDGRRVTADSPAMNRLFVAESTATITGAMADHRIALRPGAVEALARAILAGVAEGAERGAGGSVAGVADAWLAAVVQDLSSNRGSSLVIAGQGQPAVVHALVHAINDALRNVGDTVHYIEPVAARPPQAAASLPDLVSDMQAGQVDTLVMVGCNPVYSAPGGLKFSAALEQVRLRVHLAEYNDETSFLCDWHLPAAHDLETWSDARAFDGTTTILQPLIAPLYGGKTAHELLAVLAGRADRTPHQIVQEHWQREFGDDFAARWRRAVHDGVVAESESSTASVELTFDAQQRAATAESNSPAERLEIEFRPDPTIGDGRFANNGWLQELPKPLTKVTWDNVGYLSPATAERLGLASEDVVKVTVDDRSIRVPIWVLPGQADECLSLTFGYGRTRSGRVGTGIGYNAYALLGESGAWLAQGTVRGTGERYALATTQHHHSMEGRDIVRVTTIDKLVDDPTHLFDAKHHGENFPTLYPEFKYDGNAWGMTIDQTACIGCNACVVACQSENNIPVVGKEQVAVGREMHWLRIDRYYYGDLDEPETYFQPMLCQHCEKAPCEVVCPVAATVHDSEGTSNMIYNRCVGTRYCSNNCPYKVRRFNYLQFSDETTPSLKLLRNPEVTVRSRGVMEKCSYCIQRINVGRIEAKKENRRIAEGEVRTACQQVKSFLVHNGLRFMSVTVSEEIIGHKLGEFAQSRRRYFFKKKKQKNKKN